MHASLKKCFSSPATLEHAAQSATAYDNESSLHSVRSERNGIATNARPTLHQQASAPQTHSLPTRLNVRTQAPPKKRSAAKFIGAMVKQYKKATFDTPYSHESNSGERDAALASSSWGISSPYEHFGALGGVYMSGKAASNDVDGSSTTSSVSPSTHRG